GLTLGTFFWAAVSVSFLSVISNNYTFTILRIARIFAGIYLFCIGLNSVMSAIRASGSLNSNHFPNYFRHYLLGGILVQLSNAKSAVAMSAIITHSLTGPTPTWFSVSLVLIFTVISCIGHVSMAMLFSIVAFNRMYCNSRRAFQFVFGSILSFVGLSVLVVY
ncbi:MAG: LysE family transporter, partial [Bacteroidota bacterium]